MALGALGSRLVISLAVLALALAPSTADLSQTDGGRADEASRARALGREQLERRVGASTLRVVSFGCRVTQANGTAVALADGRVLTARHVVEGALLIDVSPEAGGTSVASSLVSPSADLALLRIADPPTNLDGLTLAERDAAPGTPVLVGGYARGGLGLTIVPADVVDYVEGRSRGHPGPVMRIDYRAPSGMSGGPVVDPAGHLVGLVIAVETGTRQAIAIPASDLRRRLATERFTSGVRCSASP